MKKVADVIARKGRNVTNVAPDTSVLDALRIMADQNIGSVLILENGEYRGIMTERDYSRKVILNGKSSTDTKVARAKARAYACDDRHDAPTCSADCADSFCVRDAAELGRRRQCGHARRG